MAEQLLHHPDVGAVVEHVGRARVAQHVREQPAAEAGPVARGPHDQPRALAGEPAAPRVEEHRGRRARSRPRQLGATAW